MPHQTSASHRHITVHHVHYERPRLNGCLALFLCFGTAVGVLFFGVLALVNLHSGHYGMTLVGLAGVGGLLYGLLSYLRPYA